MELLGWLLIGFFILFLAYFALRLIVSYFFTIMATWRTNPGFVIFTTIAFGLPLALVSLNLLWIFLGLSFISVLAGKLLLRASR